MELFRILKNRRFIAAVILLLLLNCVCFYITQQKSIENFGMNVDTYSTVFKDNADIFNSNYSKDLIIEKNSRFEILKSFADMEKLKSENAEEYEYYAEEEAKLIKENPDLYQEYKDGKYSYEELSALTDFYSHFAYQLEYQNNYQTYIDSILENGKDLSSKKLFADKNSFSYKSIQKSTDDFSTNKNINLSLVNDLPVNAVLNYQIGDFVLILMCVFLAISFVSQNNMNQLVNTCKNGRIKLKLKQLPLLILFSAFCSAVIYISEVIISQKIYNAPIDLSAVIQSSDMFADCILHINFLQLSAIYILFKAVIAVMIALVIWLLISLSSNIILVSGIAGLLAAIELLLYKNISVQSNLSFFKTFNIFSLFDYKSVTEYNLISFFSAPVKADIVIWCIILLITFITGVSVVLSAKHNYPIKSPKKLFAWFYIFIKKLSVLYTKLQEVFYAGRYETFKMMHIGKGLLIAVAFVAIIGFSFNTNPLVFSSTEMFLSDYYEKYGGELNDRVYESIENMQSEIDAVDAEFNLKTEQYRNKEITFEEFELAEAKSKAFDTQRKAVDELTQQIERIEPLADKGITPVMINEIGYNNLFFTQSNQSEILLLLCTVILLFSSVFSIEKASNMLSLNHCAKKGRKELYFKKMLSVLPKAFILTAISYLSVILQNDYLYKLDNPNVDIHNLECLQNIGFNATILQYILICFAFEFVFVTLAGLITASLSAFVPQIVVIIIFSCIFILPSALYMVGISSAMGISSIYQFNFNTLLLGNDINANSFILHIALAAICLMMICLSKRKWCVTEDR